MRFCLFRSMLSDDLYRAVGKRGFFNGLKCYITGQGFKYLFFLRICQFSKKNKLIKYTIYPFLRFYLSRLEFKLGISIPVSTIIGPGFYIGHFGAIIISSSAVIGKNCNVSQGVTIGRTSRGKRIGAPIIGDNVYLGPGSIVSGNIEIGDNVVIGAGCVVNFSIPEGSVVGSPRPVIITQNGSEGYVNNRV
ncbi:serine O-acetyltransferase [Aliamphritea ceti]|uniref:serine O-acetyltransferase n=1 Tax=Aliamphritea ceti TaxID=1524258 RepID=UPI0021C4875C|nr:hypothetical protein [Aliamphritea ceti]